MKSVYGYHLPGGSVEQERTTPDYSVKKGAKDMKHIVPAIAVLLLFWTSVSANAALWDRGGGLIYDDTLNITWLRDANLAATTGYDDDGLMTSPEAAAWAESLVFQGYPDWRLPNAHNFDGSNPDYGWNQQSNEMGHLYYVELGNPAVKDVYDLSGLEQTGPFLNLQPFRYWSGTEYYLPGFQWYFNFGNGYQWDAVSGAQCYAWAVRDGDSSPVPIPGTLLLLVSGLLTCAVRIVLKVWGERRNIERRLRSPHLGRGLDGVARKPIRGDSRDRNFLLTIHLFLDCYQSTFSGRVTGCP